MTTEPQPSTSGTENEAVKALRLRRKVLADMRRIVEGVGMNSSHVILLDDYEVTNLKAALQASGYGCMTGSSPLQVLNNGDWLGQIIQKLPYVEGYKPNVDCVEMAKQAREWKPRG